MLGGADSEHFRYSLRMGNGGDGRHINTDMVPRTGKVGTLPVKGLMPQAVINSKPSFPGHETPAVAFVWRTVHVAVTACSVGQVTCVGNRIDVAVGGVAASRNVAERTKGVAVSIASVHNPVTVALRHEEGAEELRVGGPPICTVTGPNPQIPFTKCEQGTYDRRPRRHGVLGEVRDGVRRVRPGVAVPAVGAGGVVSRGRQFDLDVRERPADSQGMCR